ncbi:MAG: hypothetical protein RR525_04445 [Cellulosilyticaceae bacterium]
MVFEVSLGLAVLKEPELTFELEELLVELFFLLLKLPEFTLPEVLLEEDVPLEELDLVEKDPELILLELLLLEDRLLEDLVEPDFGFACSVYTWAAPMLIMIQPMKRKIRRLSTSCRLFIAIKAYKNIIDFI